MELCCPDEQARWQEGGTHSQNDDIYLLCNVKYSAVDF